MGFVIYSKTDGELLRYYDTKPKAQAQVTRHNRWAVIEVLKGNEYVDEWDSCRWDEYEQVFKQHYTKNKVWFINKSNF